jgi:hypothetical protein
MKILLITVLFLTLSAHANIVGISTHPLNNEGRVLSAEMTGHMSERKEIGAGLRYTQEVDRYKVFDLTAGGGQDSRGLVLGMGMNFELLSEDISQPRVSIKPFFQHQRFNDTVSSLIGAAPTLRKGFSITGQEVFPYVAIPSGIKLDSETSEFVYLASLTLGASMPFPGANNDKILLSVEGNKSMGSSSDYVGCLVSWIWK